LARWLSVSWLLAIIARVSGPTLSTRPALHYHGSR
jgi:hypothetical protein